MAEVEATVAVGSMVADFTVAGSMVGFTPVGFTLVGFTLARFTVADFTMDCTVASPACTTVSAMGTAAAGTMAGTAAATAGGRGAPGWRGLSMGLPSPRTTAPIRPAIFPT